MGKRKQSKGWQSTSQLSVNSCQSKQKAILEKLQTNCKQAILTESYAGKYNSFVFLLDMTCGLYFLYAIRMMRLLFLCCCLISCYFIFFFFVGMCLHLDIFSNSTTQRMQLLVALDESESSFTI